MKCVAAPHSMRRPRGIAWKEHTMYIGGGLLTLLLIILLLILIF